MNCYLKCYYEHKHSKEVDTMYLLYFEYGKKSIIKIIFKDGSKKKVTIKKKIYTPLVQGQDRLYITQYIEDNKKKYNKYIKYNQLFINIDNLCIYKTINQNEPIKYILGNYKCAHVIFNCICRNFDNYGSQYSLIVFSIL